MTSLTNPLADLGGDGVADVVVGSGNQQVTASSGQDCHRLVEPIGKPEPWSFTGSRRFGR